MNVGYHNNEVPVVRGNSIRSTEEGKQPLPMYVGAIKAGDLCRRAKIDRISDNSDGYQRDVTQGRVNILQNEIANGRVDLSTALLLNVRDKSEDDLIKKGENGLCHLCLDKISHMWILDGQHRYAAVESLVKHAPDSWSSYPLHFILIIGANMTEELTQFWQVNDNAKNVPTDLALVQLKKLSDSSTLGASIKAGKDGWKVSAMNLITKLNEECEVWKNRISVSGITKDKKATIVRSASMVRSFKPLLQQEGSIFRHFSFDQQFDVLDAYWQAVRDSIPNVFVDKYMDVGVDSKEQKEKSHGYKRYALQKGIGAVVMHEVLLFLLSQLVIGGKSEECYNADAYKPSLKKISDNFDESFWRDAAGSYSSEKGMKELASKMKSLLHS